MSIVQELRSATSLLTVREVADRTGTCIATIRRYAASGKLASFRIGNRLRFDLSALAVFLEKRSSE